MKQKNTEPLSELFIGVCDATGATSTLLETRLSQLPLKLASLDLDMTAEDIPSLTRDLDLVIIDLDNGETEGFDFAQLIRNHRVSKPEIIFTSSNPNISIAECHQAGGVGLMEKPLNLVDFRVLTDQAINRRESLRFDVDSYPGLIKTANNTKLDSIVKNIGRGGFFFEFPLEAHPPQIGELLEFSIHIEAFPNFHLQGKGIVRWIKGGPKPGAGIEFIEIPDEDNKLIKAFVELFRIKAFVPSAEDA